MKIISGFNHIHGHMTVVYPLWCVVCKDCHFVGTRWEKPGTRADYIEFCPSCVKNQVVHQKVQDESQHQQIESGKISYSEITARNTFKK